MSEEQKKQIIDLIAGEAELRSKRELIEKFIQNNLPKIDDANDVEDKFKTCWAEETKKALEDLSNTETLQKIK
jgi:type I restriction enzyme R subunit